MVNERGDTAGDGAADLWLYCDGGSRGNPGPGAIGVLVVDEVGRELERYASCIGRTTNNQAEYMALIRGLEIARRHSQSRLHCRMDSQLVVNQMNGLWRVRDANLRRLHHEAAKRAQAFKSVEYIHVRRGDERIVQVDRLLNEALDATS